MSSVKRSKHGVTVWQPDKAYPGFTLFNPLYMDWSMLEGAKTSRVYLIDMKGDIVHHWTVPGLVRLHADMLPNGNILVGVDEKKYAGTKKGGLAFCVTTMMELDWDSNVVWEFADPTGMIDCHDHAYLPNGNVLINMLAPISEEMQERIKGGEITYYDGGNGEMYTLVLTEVDRNGNIVDEMNLAEVLDPDKNVITPTRAATSGPA